MGSTIRVTHLAHGLILVNTAVILDNRLSLRARGLFLYLLAKPEDWQVEIKALVEELQEGRDAIYGAMRELGNYGYITKQQQTQPDGTFGEIEYVLHEQPTPAAPPEASTAYGYSANGFTANGNYVYGSSRAVSYSLSNTPVTGTYLEDNTLTSSINTPVTGTHLEGNTVPLQGTTSIGLGYDDTSFSNFTSPSSSIANALELEAEERLEKAPPLAVGFTVNADGMVVPVPIGTKRRTSTGPITYSAAYERFWEQYGRKGNKRDAYKRWKEENGDAVPQEEMEAGIDRYLTLLALEDRPQQDAQRWIHGRGWEEEWKPASRHGSAPQSVQGKRLSDVDRLIAEAREREDGNN